MLEGEKPMKKVVALLAVLGMSSIASAGFVLNIDVNDQPWDGSDVKPSDVIKLTLYEDSQNLLGLLETNTHVSDGEVQDSMFETGQSNPQWFIAGGETRGGTARGFDIFFNAATFLGVNPGNRWMVWFHVPELPASSEIIIDANGGYWNSENPAGHGPDDGLPYAVLHVIPEPMTLSLLGLGGLGLLRRRRA
jgi:hypothetical protein